MNRISKMTITWDDLTPSEGSRWFTVSTDDQYSIFWRITEEMKERQKKGQKQPNYKEMMILIAEIALFLDLGTLGHIFSKWESKVLQWDPLKVDHTLWTGYYF